MFGNICMKAMTFHTKNLASANFENGKQGLNLKVNQPFMKFALWLYTSLKSPQDQLNEEVS